MKGKLLLIGVGAGIGYILGAKAGRERYDQIAAAVGKVWHSPFVEKQFDRTTTFVNDQLDNAAGLVNAGAKNLIDRVTTGHRRPAAPAELVVAPTSPAPPASE